MNPANSSSLLHFTRSKQGLMGILRNGFRFSYSFERFPEEVIHNYLNPENPVECCLNYTNYQGIAIPMVSFCDIPITRAKQHSSFYGEYVVGIDKIVASELYNGCLNPLTYISSDNIWRSLIDVSIAKAKCEVLWNDSIIDISLKCAKDVSEFSDIDEAKNYVLPRVKSEAEKKIFYLNMQRSAASLFAISKPAWGSDLMHPQKNYCFYDEREWRAFIPDNRDQDSNWIWDFKNETFKSLDAFRKWITPYNKALHKSKYAYMPLSSDMQEELLMSLITHIVVKKDKQIPTLINEINGLNKIFGYRLEPNSSLTKKLRDILKSRINSFERIELDY